MTTSPAGRARPTLLIVGCGDVGLRVLRHLSPRWRVFALTSSSARRDELRQAGATPLIGDLDRLDTLMRLGGVADAVLHLAPPLEGRCDLRTARLLRALARYGRVRRIVYGSTTGVYGDAGGDRINEMHAIHPQSDRARRRADAERRLRWYGRAFGVPVTILRIPGIYALDRAGGDPRERLRRGTPVLAEPDDVYTNHIHADDLARLCIAALTRGLPQRVLNASDDTELKMGDYFDLVADLHGLPRPLRILRAQAEQQLTPMQLSFMSESRRLDNTRMKRELRVQLRYPSVREGLNAANAQMAVDRANSES